MVALEPRHPDGMFPALSPQALCSGSWGAPGPSDCLQGRTQGTASEEGSHLLGNLGSCHARGGSGSAGHALEGRMFQAGRESICQACQFLHWLRSPALCRPLGIERRASLRPGLWRLLVASQTLVLPRLALIATGLRAQTQTVG